VIFRGMSRAAADRFPSVADFVAALEAAAAVKEPSLPNAVPDEDELPPLAGEATRITGAGDAPSDAELADAADAEDPPAPPPEDAPPSKEPRTPTIPSPMAVLGLGGPTYEMPAVVSNEESTEERVPLPSLSTLVVQKLSDGSTPPSSPMPRPINEPRVTLKTMNAATAPSGWEAVGADATKSVYAPPRWLWLILGVFAGIAAALTVMFLLRR
jgi:hypothetical protein